MSSQSESRFWDKYIYKTTSYNIKPDVARWYVRHAEAYIKAHNKRLAMHSANDVVHYLTEKGRSLSLHNWQFRQIVTAIKILFTEMVTVPWGNNFPWDEWIEESETLEDSHPTVARDYLPINESRTENVIRSQNSNSNPKSLYKKVYSQYPDYIERLIKSIRLMHYSYRTEQTYLGWVLRFIRYNSMKDPASYDETHISKFLEYLVIQRKVSSSTQSQALNALIYFYRNVLGRKLSDDIQFARSKKPKRLPVVLSREEVSTLFSQINNPTYQLMANLLYGCGMRLMECVRLRVLD